MISKEWIEFSYIPRTVRRNFPKEIPERSTRDSTYMIEGEAVDVPQEKTGGAIMVVSTNSRKDLMVVESKVDSSE